MSSRPVTQIEELNERSREIFRRIVDAYMEAGAPVGSRTISRMLGNTLSPATIRNVMSDLEDLGLLYAPHTSAGRIPTEAGLRLFVHGLLEVGRLTEDERREVENQCASSGRSAPKVLEEALTMLSGLSRCAGLVLAPKAEVALKHVEFISLSENRALVILVTESGQVENRIIRIPPGVLPATLVQASNYLNAQIIGRTLNEARNEVQAAMEAQRAELDTLTKRVVAAGLATFVDDADHGGALILRGQANLLEDVTAVEDLERIRNLFGALETKESLLRLLDAANGGEGIQIFIGAESELFNLAGCSLIIAPYAESSERIVGAVGVVGPTRINYARIIPLVDYTAKVIGRIIT